VNTHNLVVDEESANLRLDVYLSQQLEEMPSRTFIQKMIEAGRVLVNDKVVRQRYKVAMGDQVSVEVSDDLLPDTQLKAEKIPLNVFYEDEAIIVINKPSGMTVHPAAGNYSGTLANALMHRFKELSDINPGRPGIVHRLDRDTSGLIVVAKTNQAHARLGRQFEKHTVIKRYVALVHGIVRFDQGVIEVPLKRHVKHHDQRQVAAEGEGKDATTYYEVLKRFAKVTMVGLYPQTGRTHQLRVHMKHLGHPILGDDKYGQKETFSRLALHAQAIAFEHPTSRQLVEFCCPPPKEFLSYAGATRAERSSVK
jgi:23S rRNA pseudouridine1911/1915/1917 synthase